MSGKPQIQVPAETRTRQRRAADPAVSAWVAANAGAGKTYVLAERVVRLMLAGTDPGRVLCLTFTRAAAAEMANRVFEILGAWTRLDDNALDRAIENVAGERLPAARRSFARQLFARALETPVGLKIQTIHAFCDRILHDFPFEANVPGHFEVLDENQARELLDEARAAVLHEAAASSDSALGRALFTVIDAAADVSAEKAIGALVHDRDLLAGWVGTSASPEAAAAELETLLGADDGRSLDDLHREMLDSPDFPPDYLHAVTEAAAATGSSMNIGFAGRVSLAETAATLAARRDAWLEAFFIDGGNGAPRARLVTKAVASSFPDLDERAAREAARLADLREAARLMRALAATRALLILAYGIIGKYEAAKRRVGVLDYGDLIARTAALLDRRDASAWVQYKLDRGIDHILVDEAQDTSPAQWGIVTALAEEFFAGEGARGVRRTVFAVGDEKQSIYSFQGAVPAWFDAMRRKFEALASGVGAPFENVRLNLSFRSTGDVLAAVDGVFADADVHRGLTELPEAPVHEAIRRGEPGVVEIWPVFAPSEVEAPDDWAAPLDTRLDDDPATRLARTIAATIRGWLDRGETLDANGAPIGPGDILILLRRRNPLAEIILRALKDRDIPVAGADRLVLIDHIAIQDLMALGHFVLLPDDDHTLACLMKGPLIGLSEDNLFRLAHDRTGSLWAALAKAAGNDPVLAAAHQRLSDWRRIADTMPPYEFFARALGRDGGRRAFFARLGREAEEALDEFLTLALDFERTAPATLQRFLAWLGATAPVIARDQDSRRDEVRVMTVHGAKGLEAPIVFLADTCSPPGPRNDPVVLKLAPSDEGRSEAVLWNTGKADRTALHEAAIAAARRRADEEYRRLLYVAMTRARDRLTVCGHVGKTGVPEGSWYAHIRNGLEARCTPKPCPGADEPALIFRTTKRRPVEPKQADAAPAIEPPPPWLKAPVPDTAPEARITATAPAPTGRDMSAPARRRAARRGELIHRLLEALPDLPEPARAQAGARYLVAVAEDVDDGERTALLEEALRIMAEPAFAAAFAPGSRAEVDLFGSVDIGGRRVRAGGRVDRLAVTDRGVLVVDFKTSRRVPETAAAVDRGSLLQLAIYCRLLGDLYPDRTITAALIFTAAPKLVPIPAALLEAVLDDNGDEPEPALDADRWRS